VQDGVAETFVPQWCGMARGRCAWRGLEHRGGMVSQVGGAAQAGGATGGMTWHGDMVG
jgi:hypothetical protein